MNNHVKCKNLVFEKFKFFTYFLHISIISPTSPPPPSTRTKCPTYSRCCCAPCRTGGPLPSSYSPAVSSRLRWPHSTSSSWTTALTCSAASSTPSSSKTTPLSNLVSV